MNTDQLELPELSSERLDEIERELFTRIRHDGADLGAARRTRRRRAWVATGAAAAVIAVAAIIGPSLTGGLGLGGSSMGAADSAAEPELAPADGGAEVYSGDGTDFEGDSTLGSAGGTDQPSEESTGRREVIATASVTLETTDAAAASDRISDLATDAGGYVESLSLQRSGTLETGAGDVAIEPYAGDAWITVRVPAAELTEVTTALGEIGEVRSSEVQRADVTAEVVDLRARAEALEASVDRLRELMTDADSTADLLTAEDALSARQAELDSLRGQLAVLDDQVALSSLTVSLTEPAPITEADPTGFGDGLGAGWNTLVATLNGIVIGLGFLLPWLVVIAVVVTVVALVVRTVRRRRERNLPVDTE
jgi:hypothetical protein